MIVDIKEHRRKTNSWVLTRASRSYLRNLCSTFSFSGGAGLLSRIVWQAVRPGSWSMGEEQESKSFRALPF